MRHALQAQHRAQVVLAHAPRVPQEPSRTLRGDRHAIRALQGLRVAPEQLSVTTWRRLAVLRALHQPLEREAALHAHQDSDLTQRTQRASSVRREAMRLLKAAPSVSPAQQEDLAARLELLRAQPARLEPSQQPMAQQRALHVRARQSPHVLARRTVLRVLAVRNRIKRERSASNFS